MSNLPKCKLCGCIAYADTTDGNAIAWCSNGDCDLNDGCMTVRAWNALMAEPEPDMFWDYNDAEEGYECMDDLVTQYADYNMNFGEVAEIIIQCAKKMPKRRIQITTPSDEIDGTTWEWIK